MRKVKKAYTIVNWADLRKNQAQVPADLSRLCPSCGATIKPIFKPVPPEGKWEEGTMCSSMQCKNERAAFAKTSAGRAMHFSLIVGNDVEAQRLQDARYTFEGWLSNSVPSHDVYVHAMMDKNHGTHNAELNVIAYAKLKRFITDRIGFLTLQGSHGIGKTFFEALACNQMLDWYFQQPTTRMRPVFASLSAFSEAYHAARQRTGLNDAYVLINRAKHASLLVLDDVGQVGMRSYEFRKGEDAELQSAPELRNAIFDIFDYRYQAGFPTIVSVNHAEDIDNALGKGASARLHYGIIVSMEGSDLRRKEYRDHIQEQRDRSE